MKKLIFATALVVWQGVVCNQSFSQPQCKQEGTLTTIVGLAQSVEEYVFAIRALLHQIPELRFEEEQTLQLIADEAHTIVTSFDAQARIEFYQGKGGIWLDVTFDDAFDRILLRADVDALPIQENTGLSFASMHPGKMHACGHDIHSAMLLGALRAIMQGVAEGKITPKHNLRFVWQRAEENPGQPPYESSGGKVMVQEGVLEGITSVHGLHIWNDPSGEAGVFYSRPGQAMANSDRTQIVLQGPDALLAARDVLLMLRGLNEDCLGPQIPCSFVPAVFKSLGRTGVGSVPKAERYSWFEIKVEAPGGHVMSPEHGSNALDIAAELMYQLRGLPVRVLGANYPCNLLLSHIEAGSGSNIRPASARLTYVLCHSLDTAEIERLKQAIENEVARRAGLYPGGSAEARVWTNSTNQSEQLLRLDDYVEIWFGNRHLLPDDERRSFEHCIARRVQSVVEGYYAGTVAQFNFVHGHPALSNDPTSTAVTANGLKQVGYRVRTMEPSFGGEDFAWYLKQRPGSFWMLGARTAHSGGDHHTPTFNPEPSVFYQGVVYWLLLATN